MSIYTHSLKTATKSVESLKAIVEKLPAYLDSKKGMRGNNLISEVYVLESRIAPDMFPLVKQIQLVSDMLKAMASKMSGIENPSMEDKETSIVELITRLEKTIEFAKSIPESAFEGAADRQAFSPWMPGKYQTMEDYLVESALPNIYFHITTAYNILRSLGMQIGKQDFVGSLTLHDVE
jgi:uncharacterized protein